MVLICAYVGGHQQLLFQPGKLESSVFTVAASIQQSVTRAVRGGPDTGRDNCDIFFLQNLSQTPHDVVNIN